MGFGERNKAVRRVVNLFFALTLLAVFMPMEAFATLGGFEGDDGNLAPATDVDWNSFTTTATADAWHFHNFNDATGNPDDKYAGGVKQDDDCADITIGSMGGGSAKFDLKRIRLAHKQVDGDEILAMSWIRVPSSPSASSHVAYEFNKAENGTCDPNDDQEDPEGLLVRTVGDLLFVFDFEGGEADSEVRVTKWVDSGTCEVSQSTPPCWGDPQTLTGSHAEAKVNSPSVGNVTDALGNETLAPVQFGETAINLTEAGLFDPDTCEGFGFVTGVSRSSGNSGIAQMKDKVGPNKFDLANCGSVLVNKVDGNGDLLGGATIKITPADNVDANGDIIDEDLVTPMAEGDDGVFCTDELFFDDYVVFETEAPGGYTPDDTYHPVTVDAFSTCAGRLGDEGTEDDDVPDVTITNNPEPGRILILKEDDAGNPLANIEFELFTDDDADGAYDDGDSEDPAPDTTTGGTCTTDAAGICREDGVSGDDRPAFDQVEPGLYCVVEVASSIPAEYAGADPRCFEVETGIAGGDTIDYVLDPFVDPRLHNVIVIVCHEGTDTLIESTVDNGSGSLDTIGGGDATDEEEAYLCGLDGFEHKPHGSKALTVHVGETGDPLAVHD